MDLEYDALRKSENIIVMSNDDELIAFLKQFYNIVSIDSSYDPENTMYYSETFDIMTVGEIRCKYMWSASTIAPEIKKTIPSDKTVVENKNIKDEYIMRFLRNCSI
jgi:alpha-mannosidase